MEWRVIGLNLLYAGLGVVMMFGAYRLIDIFTSTFELMQSKITTETAAASTLLIEPTFPETSGFGLRQFPEGRRYIPIGEEAVEAALPRLTASLPWLRGKRHHIINV